MRSPALTTRDGDPHLHQPVRSFQRRYPGCILGFIVLNFFKRCFAGNSMDGSR